jgi:hypothetical protein
VATGVATTSYIDTGLTNGATYYYVVVAESGSSVSATSPEASVIPGSTGPGAYLRFDETSGTTAADSTGNGWTGTCWNSPAWVAGKINNALSLNGTNSYVTLPSGVVSAFTDFTISAWVKVNSVANWQRIFDFGTGTTYYMMLTPENGNNGNLRFAITTGGWPAEQQINASAPLTTGTWNHVAVTLSGSTGTLYVNGVVAGTNTAMTLNPSSLGVTTLNYIGKSQFSNPYLNGVVDDFRIYGRALSATEVVQLAAPPSAPTGVAAAGGVSQVMLGWNAASPSTGYNVYRSATSGGPYSSVAAGVTGTSNTDPSVINGATYYYVVTTVNGDAESANSTEVSATPSVLIGGAEALAPSIAMSGTGANANLAFTVQSSALGHSYQIQYSSNLASGSWINLGSPQAGTGGNLMLNVTVNTSTARCGFFRILIVR